MSEMTEQGIVPDWTVGWRMKRALDFAHLTEGQMADELGVSRATISRWSNDHGPVRDIYLKQWALRCGVPFAWLKHGATLDGVTTSSLRPPLRGRSRTA